MCIRLLWMIRVLWTSGYSIEAVIAIKQPYLVTGASVYQLNALHEPTVQCRPVEAPSSSLPTVCRVVNARCPDTFCVA